MALTDENGNMSTTMLVSPAGGYMGGNGGFGGGFGGDSWGWIILLLLFAGGGWGMGGFGMGGYGMLGYDFPWLLNGQQNIMSNTNNGFRDSMLNDGITSIRDGISSLATQLCNGFSGVNASIANGFAQAEIANNGRQIANMQQQFANQTAILQGFNNIQSQFADCCCENRLANCQTQNIIQNEGNATRFADANNTRDLLTAFNSGIQSLRDQLCDYRNEQKDDTIAQLRSELMYARGQASQDVQTALLRQSDATTANQLIQELRSCPIPAMPVYGQTPIFSCNQNNGCGCGCGNGGF